MNTDRQPSSLTNVAASSAKRFTEGGEVMVERLACSNDPHGYGVRSLVLVVGPPTAHSSDVRSPTNSDPSQRQNRRKRTHTVLPTAAKAANGCNRRITYGRRCSPCHWVVDVLLWSPHGFRSCIDILTIKDNMCRLLPRVQQQSPAAMHEWQRGQDCEIWKCLVTDLHGSRRLEYDVV